ncbi:LysE family translocator [Rhodococcus sp. H36-A4]|uniref:LysE family translocator n=1 Tax=Rhodococcus sp. H36-A4 TaxID=3004353 RepID=UPI0022AFBADC|nr:LysE family translocator [Rhodococcus sp. H36-A4]MCZ4080505.1 LysE family translocator [Rhodococcus sp. H36-A4]
MNNPVLAYLPVAIVFGVIPGPDVMLAVKHSLSGGVRQGIAVALGAATGSMAWGIAAAVGLASLLSSVPGAFDAVRIAGAAYLVYLGIQSIWQRKGSFTDIDAATFIAQQPKWSRSFMTGFIADLLNPKMGAFYLAVLPQFIPRDGNVFVWSMLLMSIEFVVALICLSSYAFLASRARQFLEKGKLGAWMERALGVVLVGFGIRLAFE